MKRLLQQVLWMPFVLMAAAALQPVQAQQVRVIGTQAYQPPDAPVRISAYEATAQTLDDGFYTLAFLTETVTLENVTQYRVAAVEVQFLYLDAFGEQVDVASETLIREVGAGTSVTETFRSPLSYPVPIYTAIVYPSRVRLEPAGRPERATFWQADSTEVNNQLRRMVSTLAAREQE